MKNNPLAYFVGGAVICAVLLAFVTRDRWQGKPDAVQTAAATTQAGEEKQPAQSTAEQNESTKTEQAATPPPTKEPEPAPEPAKPAEVAEVKPLIDNVAVTPDGMAIVSGRAKAGTKLKILLGEEVIGEATANSVGDWYLSPEPILPPGEHYLVAVATPEGGEPVRSAPSSKIVVAQKAEPEPQQTAAAETATKDPAVSEQQPTAQEEAAEAPKEPAVEQQVAAVDTTSKEPEQEPVKTPEVKAEPEPQPAPEPEVAAKSVPDEPQPKPAPIVQDSMRLDYNDAGEIIVSGTSEPGGKVRIFVDDKPVGEVLADASGQWLFKDDGKIAPGVQDLRADKVLNDGKLVAGESFAIKRADPVKIAQSQPDPVKQNETVATKTPEPAAPVTEETQGTQVAKATTLSAGSETEQAATPAQQVQPAEETKTAMVAAESEPVNEESTASMTPALGRVVIQPGNNLWNISRVIYGRGIEYTTIYEANKEQISNPHRIYPGQIFMTPGTVPPEEIDPKRREPLSDDEKQVQ